MTKMLSQKLSGYFSRSFGRTQGATIRAYVDTCTDMVILLDSSKIIKAPPPGMNSFRIYHIMDHKDPQDATIKKIMWTIFQVKS